MNRKNIIIQGDNTINNINQKIILESGGKIKTNFNSSSSFSFINFPLESLFGIFLNKNKNLKFKFKMEKVKGKKNAPYVLILVIIIP